MRSTATAPTSVQSLGRRHEILGILAGAATILLGLALWSYDQRGGENWVGPVGEAVAGFFVSAFGLGAAWLPIELGLLTFELFRKQSAEAWVTRVASLIVVLLIGCALLHLTMPSHVVFGGHPAGGLTGEVLGEVMREFVGTAGAYVLCISTLLVNLVLRTRFSVVVAGRRFGGSLHEIAQRALAWLRENVQELARAWREAKAIEAEELARAQEAEAPRITTSTGRTLAPSAVDLRGAAADGAKRKKTRAARTYSTPPRTKKRRPRVQRLPRARPPPGSRPAPVAKPEPAARKKKGGPVIVAPRQEPINAAAAAPIMACRRRPRATAARTCCRRRHCWRRRATACCASTRPRSRRTQCGWSRSSPRTA